MLPVGLVKNLFFFCLFWRHAAPVLCTFQWATDRYRRLRDLPSTLDVLVAGELKVQQIEKKKFIVHITRLPLRTYEPIN